MTSGNLQGFYFGHATLTERTDILDRKVCGQYLTIANESQLSLHRNPPLQESIREDSAAYCEPISPVAGDNQLKGAPRWQ